MESINQVLESIQTWILGLDATIVGRIAMGVGAIVIILNVLFAWGVLKSKEIRERYTNTVDKTRQILINSMQVSKVKVFNYDEVQSFINRKGLGYMSNDKLTPVMYIFIRIAAAIFCLIIGLQINWVYGIGALIIGWVLPDAIIGESNRADNKKMLDDIKKIYDTLRIQTKAGSYITSILTECYLVVSNKRLKNGLLKLSSSIAAKNDLDLALDDFRARFDNEYIDTLVIVIKQSMKTGQAAQMFDDIRAQIQDIEAAIIHQEQVAIRNRITAVQVMLYSAIIGVAMFMAFSSLTTSLQF